MAQEDKYKHYFVPGELIIMVEHDATTDSAAIEEAMVGYLAQLNELGREYTQKYEMQLMDVYKRSNPEAFPIYTYGASTDRERYFSTKKIAYPVGSEEDRIQFVIDWMTLFGREGRDIAQGNVITANWLAVPTPQPGMDGGPGGPPEEDTTPDTDKWRFDISVLAENAEVDGDCETPIDVFVLDTLPDEQRLTWAKTELVGHPLWDAVSKQMTQFPPHVSIALQSLDETKAEDDYNKSDHGIFIAGTVATLAEHANIHLVEVLNKWGYGTLESVLEGLRYVAQKKHERGNKTVINCSFMISVPLTNRNLTPPVHPIVREFLTRSVIHADDYVVDDEKPNKGGKGQGYGEPFVARDEVEAWLIRPLIEILNILYADQPMPECKDDAYTNATNANVLIFAAAGNNGKRGKHPPAMYPAAYRPVSGVGALDDKKDNLMAVYSNIADSPVTEGFLTAGGLPGQEGLLGLYIYETYPGPPQKSNNTGWALWSGTSFATGVMSGLAARMLCNNSAGDVLDKLYKLPDTGSGAPNEVRVKQS